jgi:hypothetical protein
MLVKMTSRNQDRAIGASLFAIALAVYLRTMCPTLYWGDCGELATAAFNLGIAHPTGYPLWCLVGNLWTHIIPFGTIVWRLNTMSAFFGALAIPCVYGFLRYNEIPKSIAAAASGMLAFSFTLWQQCLFCETYSMTAFYTCLLLMLAGRWNARGRQDIDLRWIAVGYGFAMTNHQTNTLFLPGFLVYILCSEPRLRHLREAAVRRVWLRTIGTGLLPLLCYVYLPIRAMAKPDMSWGYPRTPFELYYHITGRNYAHLMFHMPFHEVWAEFLVWAGGLGRELHWGFVAFALVGIAAVCVRRSGRPLAFLLLWMLTADVVYTCNYSIYNQYIYFIPSYIALSVLAAVGVSAGWERIKRGIDTPKQPRFALLASVCILLLPPFQAVRHFHLDDLSRNWTCLDYARNLLATVPKGALIIDNGKDTSAFTIGYLQSVEHYRTDVTLIRRGTLTGLYNSDVGRFMNVWYLRQMMEHDHEIAGLFLKRPLAPAECLGEEPLRWIITDAVTKGRPVFAIDPNDYPHLHSTDPKIRTIQDYMETQGELAQIGLLVRVYRRDQFPSDAQLLAETKRVWANYTMRGVYDGMYVDDDYLTGMALEYATGELARARLAMRMHDLDTAETAYKDVLHLFVSNEATKGLQECAELRAKAPPHPPAESSPPKIPAAYASDAA